VWGAHRAWREVEGEKDGLQVGPKELVEEHKGEHVQTSRNLGERMMRKSQVLLEDH
jgi:hypothetical protein